jgi:hypothetical protein
MFNLSNKKSVQVGNDVTPSRTDLRSMFRKRSDDAWAASKALRSQGDEIFKLLESGCDVSESQLEKLTRLTGAIASLYFMAFALMLPSIKAT